jgi:hypothetical protein
MAELMSDALACARRLRELLVSFVMRRPLALTVAILLPACAPALVSYRVTDYGVTQKDAVCGDTFYVLTDDKIADEPEQKWPSVKSWLARAELRTTDDQMAPAVIIQFYSHPNVACTHCDWPPDDRWTALLYTARSAVAHFELEGANRPGADPGRAFVHALVKLRRQTGCPAT